MTRTRNPHSTLTPESDLYPRVNTTSDRHLVQLKAVLQRWFDRSMTRRKSFRIMSELMGPVGGSAGLSVVAEDVLVSYQLSTAGKTWDVVSILPEPGHAVQCLYGRDIKQWQDGALPFEDKTFDVILLDNVLEYVTHDEAFIAECHRVMKPSGYLILKVPDAKRFSLLNLVRRWLGLDGWEQGRARIGYTESDLFAILKDGFDTEDVRKWGRFFSRTVETIIQTVIALSGAGQQLTGQTGDEERSLMSYRRIVRVYGFFLPLGWLAHALDGLLFFTRGYDMGIRARHRAWKPRLAPELRDGRSIADATINTKIGTAGPF